MAVTIIILSFNNSAYADLYLGTDNYFKNCEGITAKVLLGGQPCNDLLTPDGHSLTDSGVKTFACMGSVALNPIFGEDTAIQIINANNEQCGGTYQGNSNGHHGFASTNLPLVDLSGHNGDSLGKRLYCAILC